MDNEKRCAYSVYYLGLGGAKIRLLWVFFDKNLTVLKQKFFFGVMILMPMLESGVGLCAYLALGVPPTWQIREC
jgi:hypothetical protein